MGPVGMRAEEMRARTAVSRARGGPGWCGGGRRRLRLGPTRSRSRSRPAPTRLELLASCVRGRSRGARRRRGGSPTLRRRGGGGDPGSRRRGGTPDPGKIAGTRLERFVTEGELTGADSGGEVPEGVEGYLAVRGQLAPGDGDHAARPHAHEVLAGSGGRCLLPER
jgi:hypothetical protein